MFLCDLIIEYISRLKKWIFNVLLFLKNVMICLSDVFFFRKLNNGCDVIGCCIYKCLSFCVSVELLRCVGYLLLMWCILLLSYVCLIYWCICVSDGLNWLVVCGDVLLMMCSLYSRNNVWWIVFVVFVLCLISVCLSVLCICCRNIFFYFGCNFVCFLSSILLSNFDIVWFSGSDSEVSRGIGMVVMLGKVFLMYCFLSMLFFFYLWKSVMLCDVMKIKEIDRYVFVN